MIESKGRKRLFDMTAPAEIRIADIARALNVTQQAVRSWRDGIRRPLPEYRREMERLYGIPVASWDGPSPGKRAERKAA